MEETVITVAELPKSLRSFFFSPGAVFSDRENIDLIAGIKDDMFGERCCESVKRLGIDLYDLVFINEKPFCDCFDINVNKNYIKEEDVLKTAFIIRKMYSGDHVRLARIHIKGDIAYVKDPEYCYLRITGENGRKDPVKRRLAGERKKAPENADMNRHASVIMESVRIAALKYTMERCMAYKELIDKYNIRRFSTNLRLNTRPSDISEINAAMSLKKDRLFADFSKEKTRVNFCVLYAIAYGGYSIGDIYSRNTVFEESSPETDRKLSDLSSDLLTILYNGNGIEIAGVLINMIVKFTESELPPVDLNDLDTVLENYSVYYAVANLAAICDNIFRIDSDNRSSMREYLNKHSFLNYWTVIDRLSFMKQYSAVVSFCYKISTFDVELYRQDPEYQGSVLYSFESARKFAEELKNIE